MAGRPSITAEVDPISRIEGHLGVEVTTDGTGVITGANVHGNLWRGFENFLLGRDINDAITFTQRICGVCPIPHATASTFAADAVLGYSRGHITFANVDDTDKDAAGLNYGVPPKAVIIRNLVYASEFLMSHITHFYHLVAPSYVQGPAMPPWTPFFADDYYHAALLNVDDVATPEVPVLGTPNTWTDPLKNRDVWDAVIISYVRALRVRRLTFEAGALFAGRMPMTSCFLAGGVTNDHTADLTARIAKFRELMEEIGKFIVNEYVPIALVLGMLYPTYDSNNADFTQKAEGGIGAGCGRFLAWGAFPAADATGTLALPGGLKTASVYGITSTDTDFVALDKQDVYDNFLAGMPHEVPDNLTEDIAESRYAVADGDLDVYADGVRTYSSATAAYPGDVTRTKPARANGYSYIKAPRWAGDACEVGPFARLAVAGIYPVDKTTIWAHAAMANALALYTNAGGTALDPTVIAPTIVAALVNAGLLVADGTGPVFDWIANLKGGLSTMDRLRARAIESLYLVQQMIGTVSKDALGNLTFTGGWIDDAALSAASGATYVSRAVPVGSSQNWGCSEAPRGALMHQAAITGGKITAYQCIVPTTWNASPKDAGGELGPIEAAIVGTGTAAVTFEDFGAEFVAQDGSTKPTQGGVEALRIAQSFDPCIACAIH